MEKFKFNYSIKQNFLFSVFLLLIHKLLYCEGYNYCSGDAEKEICGRAEHIMCHKNLLPKQGDLVVLLPMTRKIKSQILDMHNDFRNRVASGEEIGKDLHVFPKASRMREMLWDEELAHVAGYHASLCSFRHDSCRSTHKFKYSGQNLGKGYLFGKIKIASILDVLNAMFDEKNLVENTVDFPKNYDVSLNSAGHFTVIVNERSSFIGCGIALCQYPGGDKIEFYQLTCNYEYTNMIGNRIYMTDDWESASKCNDWETEKSEKYEHLCKNNGRIYD